MTLSHSYILANALNSMDKGVFKCESCMFNSTRKWNINRHIKTVHMGNATAINVKSGKLSKLSTPSFKQVRTRLIPFPFHSDIYENNLEFAKVESELNLSMDKETKTMMSIYEELSKRISALELLSSNEINKSQISTFLMHSLLTENPIHTLDEIVRLLRSKAAKQKIITYASKFFNGEHTVTDIIVSSLIKDTPYYKSKSNFQSI